MRRAAGDGSFHTRANGLIQHRVSLGRDACGKRIVLMAYGRSIVECRNKMAIQIEQVRREGGVALPDGTTIGTWTAAWLARKKPAIAPATYPQYEAAVRIHIVPHLGRVRIDRLRVRDVDAWLAGLEKDGVGGRARQYARMVLGNAVRDAVRLDMVGHNVVADVHTPAHRSAEFAVWEIDEARAFLASAAECRYAAFWTLWLTTGARPHELLGLRPQDVDLTRGEISITKQLRRGGYGRAALKTRSSRRTLGLAPMAIDALKAHREGMLAEGLRASLWFFPRPDGGPTVYRTLIADHYETIVARTSTIDEKGRRVPLNRNRPYDIRHTYATLALKVGVPIKVVSEALGHVSIELTLRTYAHVLASMRDEHIDRVQELFAPSKTA